MVLDVGAVLQFWFVCLGCADLRSQVDNYVVTKFRMVTRITRTLSQVMMRRGPGYQHQRLRGTVGAV